ncbi:MAG: phenylalanine--tRNA ligase subunit beta [Rhodanobacteraceae bacterium]
MKFSENWLRSLVELPLERDALVERLTMGGLEVEHVEPLGGGLGGVVVAEILACDPHPNADKLRICRVATGSIEATVVCGAPNARAGLKAPLATVGATLPNGARIKTATLRGVESAGMLCSAAELAIGDDADGLLELPGDAPLGGTLADFLDLPDASLELKLTPNRPDCLGMRGLAREAATLFGSSLQEPAAPTVAAISTERREIHLQAGADCPRYLGRVISGIDATAPSPQWLLDRLHRSGLRSIGAVVDVTNYVMLELGQPLHAFDNDCLAGDITVRRAAAGEKLQLLDGSEPKLDPEFLVIADDNKALAVAGIIGGHVSRTTTSTCNVFLESAHFAPTAILGRARRLGLHTDASHRFERGVDFELPRLAIERASELLISIAGGSAGPVEEALLPAHLPTRPRVKLRRDRLTRVCGMTIDDAEVVRILSKLGMTVENTGDGWSIVAPSWRFDIAIEEDLIEEVVRVYGYERVPTRPPRGDLAVAPLLEEIVPERVFRAQLAARDYCEALCLAFLDRDLLELWGLADNAVALANPLSAELGAMRTSLLPGLVTALGGNRRRQRERVRLFEIGRVFQRGRDDVNEEVRIAGVACGLAVAEQWAESERRAVDFFDLKGDVESLLQLTGAPGEFMFGEADQPWLHPGRGAALSRNGRSMGYLGALHPQLLGALDLDDVYVFELALGELAARVLPRAAPLSRFPMVRRDIAIVVPENTSYGRIEATVRAAVGPVLHDIRLFDLYSGGNLGTGVKSLAMGLILQDASRTLTDQEADHCVALAVAALETGCMATLRG